MAVTKKIALFLCLACPAAWLSIGLAFPAPVLSGDRADDVPGATPGTATRNELAPKSPGAGRAGALPSSSALGASLRLDPEAVAMDLFYNEGHVTVEGILPTGTDAALIVRGQEEEVAMGMKGKRLNLWMTVGTATFARAPVFYRCLTSKPIAEMTAPGVALDAGLGYERLERDMVLHLDEKVAKTADAERDWKAEFVKYKQETGLYAIEEGALRVSGAGQGTEKVRGEIRIPARAPGGAYQVMLIGFKNGVPVARATRSLSVSLVGTVAFLRKLAMEHGWLYGIMAVLVALASGLGVGAIMPSKGGRSRK